MPRTCVALYSGGLDSALALAVLARRGVNVVAFHGVHAFSAASDSPEGRERVRQTCLALGAADVKFADLTDGIIALVKSPAHGHGKHLNPCLDCRMNTVAAAANVLRDIGADFLVSGEVVGQRPMSQRRDAMDIVLRSVRELGLEGRLLRPLSAKLLAPTLPETEGWVDRESLYDFSGRTRKPQMALARELGLESYATPGGGCLLTDPGYAARLEDLMKFQPDWTGADARLLRVGKHFRISPATKIVVSRRAEENELLERLAAPGEFLYITVENPGATVLVRGEFTPDAERIAAGLSVQHSRNRTGGEAHVRRRRAGEGGEAIELSGMIPLVKPETLQTVGVVSPDAARGSE